MGTPIRILACVLTIHLARGGGADGQMVFGWPVRVQPQPEAIPTGAGGVFWNPVWMVGFDVGRCSLAMLREGLANGSGPVHDYRAAIRFP